MTLFSGSAPTPSPPPAPAVPQPPKAEVPAQPGAISAELPQPEPAPAADTTILPEKPPASEPARPWREELSERVENFRQRRARLRQGFDPSTSLDLEFETPRGDEPDAVIGTNLIEFPHDAGEVDLSTGNSSGPQSETPVLDSVPLEKTGSGLRILGSAAVEATELTLEHGGDDPEPVEIVLESSPPPTGAPPSEARPLLLPLAPLGRRFLSGIVDALVLLLAAGLFGLIFWRAGGHLSPQPATLVVLCFIFVFFILVYFGLFTALISCTPGLLWMGLEVRNSEGTCPTARESFWRAFGYLVSITALMLGFIWALVDGDGLTWHDRMSGTFLTFADAEQDRASESRP